jgi:hypothetical protein
MAAGARAGHGEAEVGVDGSSEIQSASAGISQYAQRRATRTKIAQRGRTGRRGKMSIK